MGNSDSSNTLSAPPGCKPSNVNSRKPSSAAPVSANASVGISKATTLKYSIATLLLCTSSFTAGWYLPYVITAISGSGVIAAVPLAIFAVSTVVALISTIYLAKLVVSAINDKKEIDLNTVREVSVQPDDVSTLMAAITPTPPQVTLGTQPNQDAGVPLPPPNGSSKPKQDAGMPPPPPLPPSAAPSPPPPLPYTAASPSPSATVPQCVELLNSIRNAGGKPQKKRHNGSGSAESSTKKEGKQLGFINELKAKQGGNAENAPQTELVAKIEKEQEERRG